MIPAIPENPSPPEEPLCCPDLFNYAEALLAWIWTGTEDDEGIAECVGEDTSPCGAMVRYVSWGPPIIRPTQPNVLATYVTAPGVVVRRSKADNSPAGNLVQITDITYAVELWEGCYPIPADDMSGPSYPRFHEANRYAYSHAMKLYNRLLRGSETGLGAVFPECKVVRVAPLAPLYEGAPGISVGWRTGLQVTW